MGLFGRRKKLEELSETADENVVEQAASASAEGSSETAESATVDPFAARSTNIFADSIALEKGSGLHRIVQLMHNRGEGQKTLSLKQDGDDMQMRLYTNGVEEESAVVVPTSEWFGPVAALYTEEEEGERGEWNRALIVLNPPVGDEMSVQASFLNTVERNSHNLKYVLNAETLDDEDQAEVTDFAALVPVTGVNETPTAEQGAAYQAEKDGALEEIAQPELAESETAAEEVSVPEVKETESSESDADSAAEKFADDSQYQPLAASATGEEAEEPAELESKTTEEDSAAEPETDQAAEQAAEEAIGEEPATVESTDVESTETETQSVATAAPSMTPAFNSNKNVSAQAAEEETAEVEADSSEEVKEEMVADSVLPASIDEEPELASLPDYIDDWAIEEDTFESAPATASAPDVTSATRRVRVARPSTKKLAEGNLVLTEAEVVSRLMPVHEKLFGAGGTALDAATVLVRVRALGSYYDALTHVRRNGFWDQQRTFDLIPEDILKVLELKTASYKEGTGAPLAISLRFTPGIPPVAAFDYSSEQAFVQYNDQLPAQQYIEELRMFPRTGANIPAHMSEALASWAL